MFIESKALRPDSGGAGEFRGGLGQRIDFVNDSGGEMAIAFLAGRTEFAPLGACGGKPGALREVRVNNVIADPKGRYILKPGDRVTTFEAGGGGYGDPSRRAHEAIARDIATGFLSPERASADYGYEP